MLKKQKSIILIFSVIFFSFLLILSLIMPYSLAQSRTNCTDNSSALLFKYTVPIRNVTSNATYIPLTYLDCNVTIYREQLNVDNVLESSLMVNRNDGDYGCWISPEFPDGRYNTYYQCYANNTLVSEGHGSFRTIFQHYNNYLYSGLILIPIGLFIFGRRKQIPAFLMLSGILITTFGIALWNDRFPYFDWQTSLVTRAFALMVFCIGLYIMGRTSIEYAEEAQII